MDDEVKIDGIVYYNAYNVTIDSITYTIVILGISIPANNNDFIVGTNNTDVTLIQ
ncbi:MAG: hypothetical protein KatS3mg003_0177 [Candidatus Nitrosocaldaceae archaeon]|nr:MAG: hypothetical protein KatS3mg003_0177 [Candidatus Nitrosocaldaceae archaeon]